MVDCSNEIVIDDGLFHDVAPHPPDQQDYGGGDISP